MPVVINPHLDYRHSKRIYVGGFRRQFRNQVLREPKPTRINDFRCAPLDGVSNFSDLMISLDPRRRFCLILHSVIVDDPQPTEISQSGTQVRVDKDICLERRSVISCLVFLCLEKSFLPLSDSRERNRFDAGIAIQPRCP